MNNIDPVAQPHPSAPTPRAASSLAALVVLVVVFVIGLAVGQGGVLGPRATPRPASVGAGETPRPTTGVPPGSQPTGPADAPADFGLFWESLRIVRQNFVGRDDLTDEQITQGAIRGLVEALGDTGHSVYLTPEAVQAENESLSGRVVGIGVLLGQRDDQVVIVSVISGGPADGAGMRTGDVIVAVDGQPVIGQAPEEIAPRVRGDAGTSVRITVERPASGERLDFSVVREELRFPAASWTLVPGTSVGLLRLVQFSSGSAAELRDARDAALAAGATSLILDLRSNPGGFVNEAVDAASLFVSGRVVYLRELADDTRHPVMTNDQLTATQVPLVVLVDEGTASSAEIVSAAIAAADRAQLVGQTTFGTGTVLLNFDLPDGSALRLAVERWLTPDGELIFGRGIQPDIAVPMPAAEIPLEPADIGDMTPEEIQNLPDAQLRRALDLLTGSSEAQ